MAIYLGGKSNVKGMIWQGPNVINIFVNVKLEDSVVEVQSLNGLSQKDPNTYMCLTPCIKCDNWWFFFFFWEQETKHVASYAYSNIKKKVWFFLRNFFHPCWSIISFLKRVVRLREKGFKRGAFMCFGTVCYSQDLICCVKNWKCRF